MQIKLVGQFIQHVDVELAPSECFYAQRGALICQDSIIKKEIAVHGGGALSRLIGAKISGESIFIVRYVNHGMYPSHLMFGSTIGILPVKLQGESIICRKGCYVASTDLVNVTTKLSISGFIGGMGFMLQKIQGRATVFLDTIGQPIVRDLAPGESVECDEDHVIALHGISESQMSTSWSFRNVLGGEGLSMLRITGPGKVYLSPGSFAHYHTLKV